MSSTINHPKPFLEVRVRDLSTEPGLATVCAGYELNEWRADQLARHLLEWLPEFALSHQDLQSLSPANAMRLVAKAAHAIYNTRTASPTHRDRRGEIGEILLHAVLRQEFGTVPAISKFFFKDTANQTVHGFDSVHVVVDGTELELWLGEVKFYRDITSAMTAVVTELDEHFKRNYLRSEFTFIANKLDPSWPHYQRLLDLLDQNTSLDKQFSAIVVPVFLTYESSTVALHNEVSDEFLQELEKEVREHHRKFSDRQLPDSIRVELILLPMHLKQDLVDAFDRRLEACQTMGL